MWVFRRPETHPPNGVTDRREAIWLSYIDLDAARAGLGALTRPFGHHQLASCAHDWEALKIGGGERGRSASGIILSADGPDSGAGAHERAAAHPGEGR